MEFRISRLKIYC